MNKPAFFSGSYAPDEVHFLLRPMAMEDTPIAVKEALIQSGQKHYSQMLSHESLPAPEYLSLFHQALAANQNLMAEQLLVLAKTIVNTRPHGVTLVSLARAGTPVGVLLKHVLARYFHVDATHYSVSILRDVGLDLNALRYILQRHQPNSLVFVDGWAAKGVIARQLAESLQVFVGSDGIDIPAELYVLADLSGFAAYAASSEDYLIPSCLLNATVSGLVSRTVYDPGTASPDDFHGCVYYHQFAKNDLSNYFITTMLACVDQIWQLRGGDFGQLAHPAHKPQQLQAISRQFLQQATGQYGISQLNYIKPGIGEATRVLLRREARLLLLQNLQAGETQHLRWLAESKAIPIAVINDLPYRAVAFIKEIEL